MSKYGWDDFCEQYNADRLNEMTKQINQLEEELFSRTYKGIPVTPPEIKVGDKVRVCKERWAAEGYPEDEQRYLKEGTVVSIKRTLSWYSDRNETIYEVHFAPYSTIDNRSIFWRNSVTLRVSYEEIYSHKPKGVNFTYMLDKNYTPVVPETETLKDKFHNLWEISEKLRIQTEALKKYSDAMYKRMALLGTDIAVTTVDESPFINSHMDVASWYPKIMASVGADFDGDAIYIRANPTLLSALDFDGDESNVIGKVDKMESSKDGVKIYISQPPRCGKEIFEEIRRMADTKLKFTSRKPENEFMKTVKTGATFMNTVDIRVKKIMHNGPATIVFWKDGTKTVVRLKEGDKYDPYAAFTAAVAKRLYGKTMKISEIVDRYSKDVKVPETPPRELSLEELKEAADKLGYRVSRKPKKK